MTKSLSVIFKFQISEILIKSLSVYGICTTRFGLVHVKSSPEMFEKALNSKADYIFLDLEDAVSPMDKINARQNVIKGLKELNWREKGKTMLVFL